MICIFRGAFTDLTVPALIMNHYSFYFITIKSVCQRYDHFCGFTVRLFMLIQIPFTALTDEPAGSAVHEYIGYRGIFLQKAQEETKNNIFSHIL